MLNTSRDWNQPRNWNQSQVWNCGGHISVTLVSFPPAQDEEQDPLLNSFAQLKELLNNIKGTFTYRQQQGWPSCL